MSWSASHGWMIPLYGLVKACAENPMMGGPRIKAANIALDSDELIEHDTQREYNLLDQLDMSTALRSELCDGCGKPQVCL